MEARRVLDEAIKRLTELHEQTGAAREAYRQRLANDLQDSGEPLNAPAMARTVCGA
jgi:signal transduction histidine kinase